MPRIVIGENEWLGPWMTTRQDGAVWVPGAGHTIGLIDDNNQPIAVVYFDNYNEANVNMHIAAEPGKRWLTREFLWYCFFYPFEQLKVKRITGLVASNNAAARKFDEHIGFTLEATLKDAHPGGDLLVYCMRREQCRWLTLKDTRNGKAETSSST